MPHYIIYEINTVEGCPYRILFNEDFIEGLKEKETFQLSNIYFITKTKKLRYNLEKTYFNKNGIIDTEITLGDTSHGFKCSTSLFNLVGELKNIYKTQEDFENMLNSKNPHLIFEFDIENSKHDLLVINVKFEDNTRTLYLIPENFETVCNINFFNEPEVLYIGQSFRMLERIQSHKMLHKAVSQISDSEEVKIFFLNFKYGYGGDKNSAEIRGNMWNFWLNQDRKSKSYKTKIDLIERFLIHFFKPKYNNQHVNTNLLNDSRVREILLNEKIAAVNVGLGVYGFGYKFWTVLQPFETEFFSFDFRNPQKGYQNQILFDW